MKLLVAVCAVLAASAVAENDKFWKIDEKTVKPIMDIEGFWEGRDPLLQNAYAAGRSGRIIGGPVVTPNSIQFQAALLLRVSPTQTGLCGGALINTRTILTAAHCPDNTQSTLVRLGAHVWNVVEANQQNIEVPTSGYRIHENYSRATLANDIAILHLPNPAILNANIQVVGFQTGDNQFVGFPAVASGWGVTEFGGTSPQLRSVPLTVISNAVCSQTMGGILGMLVIPSTICTGGMNAGTAVGTCNGDSGGPLYITTAGIRYLIGLTSFGPTNCSAGLPSAYVRLTSFTDWIRTNTLH